MSLRATYILVYDSEIFQHFYGDKQYLIDAYGGSDRNFEVIRNEFTVVWDSRCTLDENDFEKLHCIQILEMNDTSQIFKTVFIHEPVYSDISADAQAQVRTWKIKWEKEEKNNREILKERNMWRDLYVKNVRPKSKMMESQNLISKERFDRIAQENIAWSKMMKEKIEEGSGFTEGARQLVEEDKLRESDPKKWEKYCRREINLDGTPKNWNPAIFILKETENATSERPEGQEQERNIDKYQDGDGCRKASETSNCDSVLGSEEDKEKEKMSCSACNCVCASLERLSDLEERINLIGQQYKSITSNKPYKCPACAGKGKTQVITNVIEPFETRIIDSQGRHFIECKTCTGKGIVWG